VLGASPAVLCLHVGLLEMLLHHFLKYDEDSVLLQKLSVCYIQCQIQSIEHYNPWKINERKCSCSNVSCSKEVVALKESGLSELQQWMWL
jgi:hypothetical protein